MSIDALIVGAGPAGLACAIAASIRGLRVRVIDAAEPPLDKACGEGVLPDAVTMLASFGVRIRTGQVLSGIRLHHAGRSVQANFPEGPGMGVRRTELHRALLERAGELGIEVVWRTAFRSLDMDAAGFIVGADGGQSRVKALAGLGGARNASITSRRLGLRQHFACAPWSDQIEIFWTERAEAYVTPVSAGEVSVAFLTTEKLEDMAAGFELFPELRARLGDASPTSTARGALTVTCRLAHVAAGRVALAGDASGSVDAITGEGLNLAFRQADALALAMADGDLAGYETAHRDIMRVPRMMSSAFLWLDRSATLRRSAIAGLSAFPAAFDTLLRLHTGAPLLGRPAASLVCGPSVMCAEAGRLVR